MTSPFADPQLRPRAPAERALDALAWLVAALVALAIRGLSFPRVFQGGEVVFAPGDAMYHLRRSLYSFENFPAVLMSDAYVNYPDGAPIPWPPLFDIVCAAAARLLVDEEAGFEVLMAWAPAVFGALTTLPIFWFVRRHASRAAALGAALVYAAAPVAASYARVGNPDHHCAVAFVGAWWLVLSLALVDAAVRRRPLATLATAHALSATALLFTWHGSLLYLGLGHAMLVGVAVLRADLALLRAQALGGLLCLVLSASALAFFPEPLGGPYSSIAPSRLHLLALAAVVAVPAFVASRSGAGSTRLSRSAWLAAAGVGFVVAVFSFQGPREGLEPALRFMTMTDGVGAVTSEQRPLFAIAGRAPGPGSELLWGGWVWLIPFAPLLAGWALCGWAAPDSGFAAEAEPRIAGAQPGDRSAGLWVGLALVFWTAVFAGLALTQRRYGNDLAPAFSVALAFGGARLARGVARRLPGSPLAWGVLLSLAILLALATPIQRLYWPFARESYGWLTRPEMRTRIVATPAHAVHRFTRAVREATPETSGYFEEGVAPEYGVVSHANLGHALQYTARRATPTDPFWAYIGPDNWERAFGLLDAQNEAEALRYANSLQARYVVTTPDAKSQTVAAWLHTFDGRGGGGAPRFSHFRLVTEVASRAPTLGAVFAGPQQRAAIPYKLFEIVPGALLRIPAPPGVSAFVTLDLRTRSGRRFRYRAVAPGDESGVAEIRVPYASGTTGPVQSDPSYAVRVGESQGIAIVRNGHVQQGARIDVELP